MSQMLGFEPPPFLDHDDARVRPAFDGLGQVAGGGAAVRGEFDLFVGEDGHFWCLSHCVLEAQAGAPLCHFVTSPPASRGEKRVGKAFGQPYRGACAGQGFFCEPR